MKIRKSLIDENPETSQLRRTIMLGYECRIKNDYVRL